MSECISVEEYRSIREVVRVNIRENVEPCGNCKNSGLKKPK